MKLKGLSYILVALGLIFTSCEEDNYDPPKSLLSGRVVYQNEAIGVRSPTVNSAGDQTNGVQLELWQPGYYFLQKIPVYVAQDGSFSAALFDGDYKLVLLGGSGPWVDNTDTINVQVRGATTVDVPVVPYYTINNQVFQRNGNNISASFNVDQVNSSRELEQVSLYIGTTTIVDVNNNNLIVNKAAADIADLNGSISLEASLPGTLSGREYVFARVGVKMVGVAERVYSPVQKIELR